MVKTTGSTKDARFPTLSNADYHNLLFTIVERFRQRVMDMSVEEAVDHMNKMGIKEEDVKWTTKT